MKALAFALTIALWSLYIWVFDPIHIEDTIVTDIGSFLYWLLGATVAGMVGIVGVQIWDNRKR